MHRSLRLAVLVLAASFLQGCSAVRLSYEHGDSLLRWWIDQYVDLTPEQDALVRERLARFHGWHRKTQLPDYVSTLRQVQTLVAGQSTVADAQALIDAIMPRAQIMAEEARPDIADFLLTLSPGQIERMARRFAEKNADHAKDIRLAEGDGGQRKAHLKRVLERAEYWFGDFSEEQKLALRQLTDAETNATPFWYEERQRRQREWLELARLVQRERPPRERIMRLLRDYAARFEAPGDPARLLLQRALRRGSAELYVAIHAMATPRQRAHARHKLGELIDDLTALQQQEPAAAALSPNPSPR